jgi:hypothetical protein
MLITMGMNLSIQTLASNTCPPLWFQAWHWHSRKTTVADLQVVFFSCLEFFFSVIVVKNV